MKKSRSSTSYVSPSLNTLFDKKARMIPLETSDFVSRVSSHSQFGIETLPSDRTFTIKKGSENHQQTGFGESILTAEMGGELGQMIRKYSGLEIGCIGSLSEHREALTKWHGYLHDSGLRDNNGRKWWVYVKCSLSGYCTAWWKVEKLVVHQNNLKLTGDTWNWVDDRKIGDQFLNDSKDYYRILGVEPTASLAQIQKNYRYLVRRFHPDLYDSCRTENQGVMRSINQAYEILSDPTTRSHYDRTVFKPNIGKKE